MTIEKEIELKNQILNLQRQKHLEEYFKMKDLNGIYHI